MPVLDSERPVAPRSALRYRPSISDDQASSQPGPLVARKSRPRPDARTTTPPVWADDLEEEERVPQRRSATPARSRSGPRTRTRGRISPLLFMGLGLIIMLVLWTGITQVWNWGSNVYNTLAYGYPRTFQIDAVVGHQDSASSPSHFLALNLHGIVSIIEFPAGDPGRAHVLASTSGLGPNADLAVVTLRFVDVNHDGKPVMLITINGMQSVLVNDGNTFRPPTASEQQQILQELQSGQ